MTRRQLQAAWAVLGVVGVGAVAMLLFALSLQAKQSEPAGDAPAGDRIAVVTTTSSPTTAAVTAASPTEAAVEVAQESGGSSTGTQARQVDHRKPAQPQADEPATTSGQPPAQPAITTTTAGMVTSHTPTMPWCYDPIGLVWYSGEGEGCIPANPHFVEYR